MTKKNDGKIFCDICERDLDSKEKYGKIKGQTGKHSCAQCRRGIRDEKVRNDHWEKEE